MLKTILIDTNLINARTEEPKISIQVIKSLGLKEGECVVAYQDQDEWDGIVCKEIQEDESEWYIQIQAETYRQVCEEKAIGREEGFLNGKISGLKEEVLILENKMIKEGISEENARRYIKEVKLKLILDN